MKFLPLSKVKNGMIAAMDIKDLNDRVLFKKGTILDSEKINIIKANGIYKPYSNDSTVYEHIDFIRMSYDEFAEAIK